MPERRRSYETVAWCYDALARIYSLGAIARAKAWPVARLRPGDRVLYAGIGSGEEAVLAARLGARVTGIDLSRSMLRAAHRRFAAAGLAAELVQGDFFDHRLGGRLRHGGRELRARHLLVPMKLSRALSSPRFADSSGRLAGAGRFCSASRPVLSSVVSAVSTIVRSTWRAGVSACRPCIPTTTTPSASMPWGSSWWSAAASVSAAAVLASTSR